MHEKGKDQCPDGHGPGVMQIGFLRLYYKLFYSAVIADVHHVYFLREISRGKSKHHIYIVAPYSSQYLSKSAKRLNRLCACHGSRSEIILNDIKKSPTLFLEVV